jgi:hypothetical protein
MIRAQLYDGTILEFPDDTPPDVVDKVAKEETFKRSRVPTPDDAGSSTVQPSLRERFSGPGFEAAGQALTGLYGGEGLAETPPEIPLTSREGGPAVPVPETVRAISDYIGDALLTAAGAGEGAYGYVVGGIGDLLVDSGVMTEQQARAFSRDLMAMPEAFAGTVPRPTLATPGRVMGRAERVMPETGPQQPPPVSPIATTPPPVSPGAVSAPSPAIPTGAIPSATVSQATGTIAPAAEAVAATAQAAEDLDTKIGRLIRQGSGFGPGAYRARQELSELAKINPEAQAAADRLGMELPVDVLSDSQQIKQAVGMTRSIGASAAASTWKDTLVAALDQADNALKEIGGATSLAEVSDQTLARLRSARDSLKNRARTIYEAVNTAVPEATEIVPVNTIDAMNEIARGLGGVEAMTAAEKNLYKMITGETGPITYKRLMREKDAIRRAKDGDIRENPYGSINTIDLEKMYKALSEDQIDNVAAVGGQELASDLRLANDLYKKKSDIDKDIISLFGKDEKGSISRVLRNAVSGATKEDISIFKKVMEKIPEDLRKEALMSAIQSVATTTSDGRRVFGFQQYSNIYSSLIRSPSIYKEIASVVGPQGEQFMRDMYQVSKRITEARANVIGTGKANQALLGAMTADGIVDKILKTSVGQRIVRTAGSAVGAAAVGPVGATVGDTIANTVLAANPARLEKASKMLNSPEFKVLAEEAATGVPSTKSINRVSNSAAYQAWAKAVGVSDPSNWIQAIILSEMATEEPEQ